MKKMNKKWKGKWVKALLGGEYVQCSDELCATGIKYDKFCCLGVVYDVVAREGEAEWVHDPGLSWSNTLTEAATNCSTHLPENFKRKIGLSLDAEQHLIAMNDDDNADFKTIAKYIKEKL